MIDFQHIIISSLIIVISSLVQGSVGFGFVLVSAPLLSLFIPLKTLVPLLVNLSLVINLMVIVSAMKDLVLREIWILIVMGIIGIPIGVYGLNTLSPYTLKMLIGVVILITSIAMLAGFKLKTKNKVYTYSFTGLLSGILNGSISMSGPPIVLFLANEGYEKDKFRANINAYFIITNIITVIVFSLNGLYTIEIFKYTGLQIISLIIGTLLGIRFSRRINEAVFKKLILLLLIITGLITIIYS